MIARKRKAIDDEDSGYDPQNPYANRDKRLSQIVATNGEQWPNAAKSALETYVGGANSSSVTYGTPTGYYLKKYCNAPTIIANTGSNSFYHIWVTFRLGEFYLDYAEAVLNYTKSGYEKGGLSMSAADAINKIRITMWRLQKKLLVQCKRHKKSLKTIKQVF